MKRLSKGILLKIGLPVAFVLLSALLFRASLKSEATRKRIQESLSTALHMDVRFDRLRPTFFKGSRISGLTASRDGGSSLYAREVFIRPKLLSLFRGQFVFSDIRVEDARLVLVDTQKTEKQNVSDARTQAALIKDGRPRLAIRSFSLKNSALDWIDEHGKYRVQVEGIQLRLSGLGTDNGEGNLRIQQGTLYNILPFKDLKAPIQITGNHYRLPSLQASAGGGTLEAIAEVSTSEASLPFSLSADAKDIDLERVSEEIPSLHSSGKIHAHVDAAGLLKQQQSIQGKGDIHLENGTLKGFGILQSLGQVFQINELTSLKVQKADAVFTIANRKLSFSEFGLSGNDINLVAPGEIDFDQHLNLRANLSLPEKLLQGRILQMFSDRFSAPDNNGQRSIAFQIAGTIDKPKPNLLEKLVGDNVGGVLNKLLGNFLKPKKTEPPAPKPQAPPEQTVPPQ